MGYYKELCIEQEDLIFKELDRLQKSFFDITGTSEYSVLDFPIEDVAYEPDMFTLTLPSFPMAQVS